MLLYRVYTPKEWFMRHWFYLLPVIPLALTACVTATTVDESPETSSSPKIASDDGSYHSAREKEMVAELNLVRTNPKAYIPFVDAYLQTAHENGKLGNYMESTSISTTIINGKKTTKTTRYSAEETYAEDVKAAQELLKILKTMKSVGKLTPARCVYEAAKKHGLDEQQRGRLGHDGSNGSYPWDRIKTSCQPLVQEGNENLVGGRKTPRDSVVGLLVDAGIENRGHRENILNPNWDVVGCYEVGMVEKTPYNWVQNFGTTHSHSSK